MTRPNVNECDRVSGQGCTDSVIAAQVVGFVEGIVNSVAALDPRDSETSCYTVFAANLAKNMLPPALATSLDPPAVINVAEQYPQRRVQLEALEFRAANERRMQLTGTRRKYRGILEKGRYVGRLAGWFGTAYGIWDAVGLEFAAAASGRCK